MTNLTSEQQTQLADYKKRKNSFLRTAGGAFGGALGLSLVTIFWIRNIYAFLGILSLGALGFSFAALQMSADITTAARLEEELNNAGVVNVEELIKDS